MQNTLTFDIETVPQQAPLTTLQDTEIEKRIDSLLLRKPDENREKTKRLIMATNPFFGEIVCIGFYKTTLSGETGSIALTGTEKQILEKFWGIVGKFDGLFISFNGIDFDVPFILKRSMYHRIEPRNNNFLDLKRYSRFPHYDVKQVISDFDRFAGGTLELICEFLGMPSPKAGGIRAENIEKEYKKGNIAGISQYCLLDVETTYKIWDISKKYTFNPTRRN